MNHIMIDLETLGTRIGSVILTIGAVRFDPHVHDLKDVFLPDLPDDVAFYRRIDRESCREIGLIENFTTVCWWEQQPQQARYEALVAQPRMRIRDALWDFVRWCGLDPIVWSHGATFDISHCEAVFSRIYSPTPWSYRDIRDTRTLYDFAGVKPVRDANHHHALHDALVQAEAVQRAYAKQRVEA